MGGLSSAEFDACEHLIKLLETEGWSTHCAKAHRFDNASDTRCASPVSLLNILYPNDALQQKQCEEGFCHRTLFDVTHEQCKVRLSVSARGSARGSLADLGAWPSLVRGGRHRTRLASPNPSPIALTQP